MAPKTRKDKNKEKGAAALKAKAARDDKDKEKRKENSDHENMMNRFRQCLEGDCCAAGNWRSRSA